MKDQNSQSQLHRLVLAILIVGFAVALPAAHAASLHAPHAADTPDAPDRQCSLVACGAFTLERASVLLAFAAIVLTLIGPRFNPPPHVRLALDPPPRFIP